MNPTLKMLVRELTPPVLMRLVVGNKTKNDYIPAADTIAAAKAQNVTICQYVERLWGIEGQTDYIIRRVKDCGALSAPQSVVEIGAGTGRYLELVRRICSPTLHQVYETADDWREWLKATYPIDAPTSDGMTLHKTKTASVDLVHAHGVFVYTPFLTTYSYLKEIRRVVRPGGYIVFDIFSEQCMTNKIADQWLRSGLRYPQIMPKQYVIETMLSGLSLKDTFTLKCGEGISEYLIFHCAR